MNRLLYNSPLRHVGKAALCTLVATGLLGSGCGGSPTEVDVSVTAYAIKPRPVRILSGDTVFAITHRGRLLTPFWVRGNGEEFRVQLYPNKSATLEATLKPGDYKLGATNYGLAKPAELRVDP